MLGVFYLIILTSIFKKIRQRYIDNRVFLPSFHGFVLLFFYSTFFFFDYSMNGRSCVFFALTLLTSVFNAIVFSVSLFPAERLPKGWRN